MVGLRLMVQTQGQTHATATSDENGEVTGTLTVVVREVPASLLDHVRPGDVIGIIPP